MTGLRLTNNIRSSRSILIAALLVLRRSLPVTALLVLLGGFGLIHRQIGHEPEKNVIRAQILESQVFESVDANNSTVPVQVASADKNVSLLSTTSDINLVGRATDIGNDSPQTNVAILLVVNDEDMQMYGTFSNIKGYATRHHYHLEVVKSTAQVPDIYWEWIHHMKQILMSYDYVLKIDLDVLFIDDISILEFSKETNKPCIGYASPLSGKKPVAGMILMEAGNETTQLLNALSDMRKTGKYEKCCHDATALQDLYKQQAWVRDLFHLNKTLQVYDQRYDPLAMERPFSIHFPSGDKTERILTWMKKYSNTTIHMKALEF